MCAFGVYDGLCVCVCGYVGACVCTHYKKKGHFIFVYDIKSAACYMNSTKK